MKYKNRIWNWTLVLVGVLLILTGSCTKDNNDNQSSFETVMQSWNTHCEIQGKALGVFDSLLVSSDTLESINSTIQYLLNNINQVESAAYNGYNAIIISYKDGKEGGIIISDPETRLLEKNSFINQTDQIIPSKEGTILLAPYYYQFSLWDNQVFESMTNNLPKVNFPSPQKVINYSVTPSSFTNLSNYGVIYISSHGCPVLLNPNAILSRDNIKEVWLVLSIPQPEEITESLLEDIDNNTIKIATFKMNDSSIVHSYGITSKFITDHNDFSNSKPVIWGGFCFGFLGTWPKNMVDAGASCYISWDWAVDPNIDCDYAEKFYDFMCETPVTDPFATTVAAYWIKYHPSYKDIDEKANTHLVQWCFNGDPLTSFQETVPSGWTVGPFHPEFESTMAGYIAANDELDVLFQANDQQTPIAGFSIMNASTLATNSTVIPDFIFCDINSSSASYSNLYWQDMDIPHPSYVSFNKFSLELFDKISGVIFGYVYNSYPDPNQPYQAEPSPVAITATFENVTVYSTVQESFPNQSKIPFDYLKNARKIVNR